MLKIRGVSGLSVDLPPRDISPDFVTIARNVTASHGKYAASYGFSTIEDLPTAIYHMHPVNDARWRQLLLIGNTYAYGWDGNTVRNITPEGEELVGLVEGEDYSSCDIGGIAVFSQIYDFPRVWGDPGSDTSEIAYLPWDADNNWKENGLQTGIIRNYKNFLVTLGEVNGEDYYPRLVRWSASVTDTNVLPYWGPTPENDAGYSELADLDTEIIDGRQLGDHFIIYSNASAYMMQWVGRPSIMRFQRLNVLPGVLAKNLVMPFESSHFVVGQTDIYVHSGGAPVSLVDERIRELLYSSITTDLLSKAFLVKNWALQEIWLCFSNEVDHGAVTALAWSWKSMTWTTRTLPESYFGVSGVSPVDFLIWGCDGTDPDCVDMSIYENWDTIPGTWAGLGPKDADMPEMLFSSFDKKLRIRANGVGDVSDSMVERHGIPLGEYNEHYTLTRVYPKIHKASAWIQVGMQMHEEAPIDWSVAQLFTPETDKSIDVRGDDLTGSLFCLRIYTDSPALWQYTGLDAEFRPAGAD